jgi:hypothetical protein
MKKWIILLILVFVVSLFAAGNQFRVQDNDGNVVWTITSTGADTSRVYKTDQTMTIFYWTADTSGDDSVDLDLSFQLYGATGWYTEKTTTIATDSTQYRWLITNTAIGSRSIWRLIVTGGTDNKKLSPVLGHFTYDSGN